MNGSHLTEGDLADLERYTLSFLLVQEMDVDPPLVALVDFCRELFNHPAHLKCLGIKQTGA